MLTEAQQALHDALATSRVLSAVPGVGRRTGIGHVAALAPDATRFVAAGLEGGTASIRDLTGKKLVRLSGHTGEVFAVGYAPDGRLVATGGADGTARLWNAATGDLVHRLRAHRGGVFATRFSADGTRLATLGADRAVRVWDVRTGRELQTFAGVHDRTEAGVAWGEGLAFVGRDRIAVSPWMRGAAPSPVVAKVLDIASGEQVAVVADPGGTARVVDLDVSPDGTLLVAGQMESGQLQLYGLPSGKLLDVVHAHGAAVLDVELSRDGRHVATGGVDGLARTWDVTRGKLREGLTLRGYRRPVGSVSFDRTGMRLVTWGQPSGEARVWDVSPAGRGEVLTLPGPQTDWHADIAFTPDGRRLVAGSGREGTVRVWSIDTGEELLVLDQHARTDAPVRAVIGVDVSPDGSRIATAGADGSARIFDAETGRQLVVIRGRHCVPGGLCVVNRAVFSPDGSRIATTGWDATVRIFDAATGRQLRVLRGHAPGGFGTYPVAWSPDGARLLSTAADGTRIWDARTGRRAARAALRRPWFLGRLEPGRPPGAHRVGDRPRGLGRVERRAAAHAGDERGVVGHGLQPRRVDAREHDGRRAGLRHPDLGLARGRRDPEAARQWPARCAQPRRSPPRRGAPETAGAVRARVGARSGAPAPDRAQPRDALADRRGVPALPTAALPRGWLRALRYAVEEALHRGELRLATDEWLQLPLPA